MVLMESKNVEMGEDAYEFSLLATDGRRYSLSGFSDFKVLVVVFMCNHCPYVQKIWGELVELQERFLDKSVRFVGINPDFHEDYPEETMEKMVEYYDRFNMNFPYLFDETQEVAKAYGAQCTPDIYVYGGGRKLAYHGRIENNELAFAIEKALVGEFVSLEDQHPSIGCSIKWQ